MLQHLVQNVLSCLLPLRVLAIWKPVLKGSSCVPLRRHLSFRQVGVLRQEAVRIGANHFKELFDELGVLRPHWGSSE